MSYVARGNSATDPFSAIESLRRMNFTDCTEKYSHEFDVDGLENIGIISHRSILRDRIATKDEFHRLHGYLRHKLTRIIFSHEKAQSKLDADCADYAEKYSYEKAQKLTTD